MEIMLRLIYNLTFVSLFILLSCINEKNKKIEKSPRIKSLTKLISPKINEEINLDDSITILVNPKYDSIDIKKIYIIYKNDTIDKSNNNFLKLNASEFKSVGKHKIKIISILSNNRKETYYSSVSIYPNKNPKKLKYRIKNIYSHDSEAYTQGLTFDENRFFESTGRRGFSSLRELELKSGKTISKPKTLPLPTLLTKIKTK